MPFPHRVFGGERCTQHQADVSLRQDVGGLIAQSRFRPGVGQLRKTKSLAVVVGGLFGIANEQLHVMDTFER